MGTVLCVGEALISLTPTAGTRLGDTDRLHVGEAGAELNVAVHLSRLGLRARFAGRVGADPFGARIRSTLVAAGVDDTFLEEDPLRRTGLYVKDPRGATTGMLYYRGGSAATAYRQVPRAAMDGVTHVHVTGITPALSADCRALVEALLRQRAVPVSFDVNYRLALWPPEEAGTVLLDLARRAAIVFVGLDEAGQVWGCRRPEDVRALLPEPAHLVVKDGSGPAVAFVGQEAVTEPAPAVEVVEPVGAGDAFAAGYLAATSLGRPPRTALRWGHTLAASVLRSLGDHGSTPARAVLEALDENGAPR